MFESSPSDDNQTLRQYRAAKNANSTNARREMVQRGVSISTARVRRPVERVNHSAHVADKDGVIGNQTPRS